VKRIAIFLTLIALASTGAPAQSRHTVGLTWTASADAAANPSLAYNVYRSAACSGAFVKLNASPDAATTYLDTAVFSGNTYCYQVTAVLSSAESAPSNVVSASIPAAILAPRAQAPCAHRGAIMGWLRCVAAIQRAQTKRSAP
jgi:fibronectin type 3 domain-containing protein